MTTNTEEAAPRANAEPAPRSAGSAVDGRGCPVSTASSRAIEHAEKALWRMVSYYGNALDDLDAAIAEDPAWPLPHVMKALLRTLALTTPETIPSHCEKLPRRRFARPL